MAKNHRLDIILGLKDEATGKLKALKTGFSGFSSGISKAFRSARNVVLGFIATLTAASVEATKFNIQTARVWTMAGGGIGTFKRLREEARGLASDFGISRAEISKGMYNALSAGVDESNLESFMSTAAKVAVADGSDISVVVDGLTTVMNSFGISSEKSEKVADDLFKTVAKGKTTFGQLSANLATVAPVAAASNIPLKQILAHVATLTSQGTPTAQAMTQIRASIIGLNKALGDGWSETMSYQEALKEVWKNADGSQTQLLKLVGSTEAVQAVLGGVGNNASTASTKLREMSDTAGEAEEAFDKLDQFNDWKRLIETARGELSRLGEKIAEETAPIVDDLRERLKKWKPEIEKLGNVVGKWVKRQYDDLTELIDTIKSPADLKTALGSLWDDLKTHILEAAHEAVKFMTKAVPAIGDLLGRAAAEALRPNQDNPTPEQKKAAKQAAAASPEALTPGGKDSVYKQELEKYKEQNRIDRLNSMGEQGLSGIPDFEAVSLARPFARMTQAVKASRPQAAPSVPPPSDAARWQQRADGYSDMANQLGDSPEGNAARDLAEEAQSKADELFSEIGDLNKSSGESIERSNQAVNSIKEMTQKQTGLLDSIVLVSDSTVDVVDTVNTKVEIMRVKLSMLADKVSQVESSVREQRS